MKQLWLILLACSTIHISALSNRDDMTGIVTSLCKSMKRLEKFYHDMQHRFAQQAKQNKSGPAVSSINEPLSSTQNEAFEGK